MSRWNQKVVVVTGATAGLGRHLADAFFNQGAIVIGVSRRPPDSPSTDERRWHFSADVTSDESVAALIRQIEDKFGRIDVLINNVGKSTRADLEHCPLTVYQDLMEANFYSAVRCSLAALPLLKQTSGMVVNIGSLAARTGWFHVAPYTTSKHALAGFSHQLRIERPDNVSCLLVCPGPIRRDDQGTRYQQQAQGLPESAQQPGAGVDLKGIDPVRLARQIEQATYHRRPQLIVPGYSRWLFGLLQIWPSLGDRLLRRFSKSSSASD